MKKAYLVTISATTRVVVDVPQDKEDNSPMRDDELFAIVTDAAIDKVLSNPRGYLVRENTEQIKEDWECPYGTFDQEERAGEEVVLTKCPFCESEDIEFVQGDDEWDKPHYRCKECNHLFDEEEYQRQELRHQISPLLDGTSEEEPLEIFFNLPSAEEEAQGLSSLEIPAIDKVFELEGDGTLWYHTYQHIEGDDWHDMDELSIGDLKALLEYIRREI